MQSQAPYDQLIHLVAARATAWLRARFDALPNPLPLCHSDAGHLGQAGLVAVVCSQLRKSPSPLQTILAPRLALAKAGRATSIKAASLGLVCLHLPDDPVVHLTGPGSADDLFREAEVIITTPVQAAMMTDAHADRFARTLMQIYDHGQRRPRLSSPHSYGTAFQICLSIADWAATHGRLTPLAQMIFCLRLIDEDHDTSGMMSDLIGHQRPDGSFPNKTGYSMQDQTLDQACAPTLAAILALHLTLYRSRSDLPPIGLAA